MTLISHGAIVSLKKLKRKARQILPGARENASDHAGSVLNLIGWEDSLSIFDQSPSEEGKPMRSRITFNS